MASRTKIRDSVISTLKDLCGDLDVLSEKNGKPEDKPLMKDKVQIIQRKIDIISVAVSSGKVANRNLPELMELCEIFTLKPDGTFDGCEADDVIDLLKQVSSKVASAFELVCFDEWNLLPEPRHGTDNSPTPGMPSEPVAEKRVNGVGNHVKVEEEKPPAPPLVLEREPSVVSNNSEHSSLAEQQSAAMKAASLVQIARPQPKKPVVLFNPMAARAKAIKEEVSSPKSVGESVSSESSTSLPVLGASNNAMPQPTPPPSASTVFKFNMPPPHMPVPQPQAQTIPVSGMGPFIQFPPVHPTKMAANVADEIVMKVLKNVPNLASTSQQGPVPLLPTSSAPNPFAPTFMPSNTLPPFFPPPLLQGPHLQGAQLFNLGSIPATGPIPFVPTSAAPTEPAPRSVTKVSSGKKKMIKIVDPSTGEEVDLSTSRPTVFRTTSETESEGAESVPQIVSDVLASAVSSGLTLVEETIEQPEHVFVEPAPPPKKAPPPGFDQAAVRSRSSSNVEENQPISTSRPSFSPLPAQKAQVPPPGFGAKSEPKPEEKKPEKVEAEVENNDWVVEWVKNWLLERTKTGKLMKTEKVFASFQQETGSDISVQDFMDICKSHSAIFRFSASGSKIELVEVIELKIIKFIITELVKMPECPVDTIFDAYVSTMRDPKQVIHVGSKFSYEEVCDLMENRAQDVIALSGDKATCFLSQNLFDSISLLCTELLQRENESKPADLFLRFQEMAPERLVFFIPFDIFLEILTRLKDVFRFVNSRVSLATSQINVENVHSPSFTRQTSGGLGDLDYFGESVNNENNAKNESSVLPSGDFACKVIDWLPEEGNFAEIKEFVDQFNQAVVSSPEILPVRPFPEPMPNVPNECLAEFRGTVSCVTMETRRVFIAFPRDPIGAGYSTAQDLTQDDDFMAYAQTAIHNAAIRKSLPSGWCDIGRAVLYYSDESDSYGRGIVISSFALPHCDVSVTINVVESLDILDIDTGVVHEKVPARHALALTKYRDIPCLVVRCSFFLEPGALPPKKRSVIRFTLDTRSLYPPVGAKDKPAKIATARAARINDYRSGVSPIPIIVLSP